jgi:hypothetical protein
MDGWTDSPRKCDKAKMTFIRVVVINVVFAKK